MSGNHIVGIISHASRRRDAAPTPNATPLSVQPTVRFAWGTTRVTNRPYSRPRSLQGHGTTKHRQVAATQPRHGSRDLWLCCSACSVEQSNRALQNTVITANYIVSDLAPTADHSFVVNFVSELLYTVPASSGLALFYSPVPPSRPN